MKKIVYLILTIIWMIIIFTFSNQKAQESTKMSDGVIEKTIGNIYKITHKNTKEEKLTEIKTKYTKPIRKLAHFTIYMILGILVTITLKEYNINKNIILISILICMLYAISDEIHQIFISGRSGEIKDVIIDTCGSTLGIILNKKIRKKS